MTILEKDKISFINSLSSALFLTKIKKLKSKKTEKKDLVFSPMFLFVYDNEREEEEGEQ